MTASGAHHRADDGKFVHHRGHLWEQFADFNTGNVRLNGIKFAPNLGRSLSLQIPHILMWRSTRKKDHDDRLMIEGLKLGFRFGA